MLRNGVLYLIHAESLTHSGIALHIQVNGY
jgi:hypothetical protein